VGIAPVLAKVIKQSNAEISQLSLQPHLGGGEGRGRAGEGHWTVSPSFLRKDSADMKPSTFRGGQEAEGEEWLHDLHARYSD
jgi:hypothetical protein